MNAHSHLPNECREFRESLDALLDRETATVSADGEAHLMACESCRSDWRAARAIMALAGARRAPASPQRTDRLFQVVLADAIAVQPARRLAGWIAVAATVAAAVLAMVVAIRWREPIAGPLPPADTIANVTPKAPSISVDGQLAQASDAIASLTRRTADRAALPTRRIFASRPEMKPLEPMPIEPAARRLADIRDGAASGFEPLAKTARRAFALFARELPEQSPRKPDF